jgi:hypothetical protein
LAGDGETELSLGSAGYGADAITVFAAITGAAALVASVFSQGKDIDANLAAWRSIGRRIQTALPRLAAKYGDVSISEPAALALCIQLLHERDIGSAGLKLLSHATTPVANGSLSEGCVDEFRFQPDRFYVFVFRDSNQDTYTVTLRSSGRVESITRLPTGDWLEYHNIEM